MVIKEERKHLILKERIRPGSTDLPLFVSEHDGAYDIQAHIKAELEEAYAKPNETVTAKGDPVHIGIDSEYVYSNEGGENIVLCYSFFLVGKSFVLKGVIYLDSADYKDRWTFERFIGYVLHEAMKRGVIDAWPRVTFVYGHFLRADVPSFKSFWKYKRDVDGLRGTISSMRQGVGVQFEDKRGKKVAIEPVALRKQDGRKIQSYVNFVDTLLLTPGRKGLDAVGEMIGIPKMEIPAPYCISRMDELLEGNKGLFNEYAMRDAEIAVKYGLRMHAFSRNVLGLKKLPLTIGACAVSLFRNQFGALEYFNEVFGIDYIKSQRWDDDKQAPRQMLRRTETVSRRFHAQFATDCFHGGRNECYVFGPTPEGRYYDYDLAGAYTTGLVDLLPLDYAGCYETKSPRDFCGHVMGLACVEFEFSEGTRFPCLPVRTEQYGLQFPRRGKSYCTAPEIEAALNMGARITIIHGVIVPWRTDDDTRIFQPFVSWVREERAKHESGSLADALAKEIGNSLYGKTGQSLKGKNVFDTHTLSSKRVKESRVTNPYIAAHTTGFVRAVIAEVMNSVPAGRTVVSVTTDGFLTDAAIDELRLTGPLAARYQALCDLVSDGEPMLVCKHQCRQVIAMKTRGQLTAMPATGVEEVKEDKRYVLAKTGVRPPRKRAGAALTKAEQNEYMVKLFLDRVPHQKHEMKHLISMREQWLTEQDLVEIKRFIRLNLEFDFKRRPTVVTTRDVRGQEHIAFTTEPWGTECQMQQARALFDGWRKGVKLEDGEYERGNVLKTEQDYESWLDWYESHLAADGKVGINVTREGSVGLLRRTFLRAITRGKWGVNTKGVTQQAIADWLTDEGYPTTLHDVKDAKGRKSKLVSGVVPVRAPTVALLEVILKRYPGFQYEHAFAAPVGPEWFEDEVAKSA